MDPLILTYGHRYAPSGEPDTAVAQLPATASNDGRVLGVEGLLDQISGSVVRQFRTEVWPEVKADRELQRTVGQAIGSGAGRALRPAATVTAFAVSALAVAGIAGVVRHWND